MKNFNKIISSTLASLVFCVLLVSTLESAPLTTKLYTHSLVLRVGDEFKLNMIVYPEQGHPIVTVSNTIVYNPKYLEFEDSVFPTGWVMLPSAPYFLTDTDLGMLRRTAGFIEGVDVPTQYVTYTFKAKKEGSATISLEDGFALDMNNVDIGLTPKAITFKILPKLPATVVATTTVEAVATHTEPIVPEVKSINLSINTLGRAALYEGEDYNFTVNLKQLPVTNDSGEIDVELLDQNGQSKYLQILLFQPGETSKEIVIPSAAFAEGDYLLKVKTIYKNLGTEVESTKTIGVLKKEGYSFLGWINVDNIRYFSGSLALLFLIIFVHMHKDHKEIKKLKTKYRRIVIKDI